MKVNLFAILIAAVMVSCNSDDEEPYHFISKETNDKNYIVAQTNGRWLQWYKDHQAKSAEIIKETKELFYHSDSIRFKNNEEKYLFLFTLFEAQFEKIGRHCIDPTGLSELVNHP